MTTIEELLKTNLFIDNEYFRKYVDLMNESCDSGYFEFHHIIPKSYFKRNNLPIDDSERNLKKLSIRNHIVAHYYLSLCSRENWFKFANTLCLNWIYLRDLRDLIDEKWLFENLPLLEKLRLEGRQLNSQLQIGLQSGEKNENNKYSYSLCTKVKDELLLGSDISYIIDKYQVPKHIIAGILDGHHWSCREDNFHIDDYKSYQKQVKFQNWLKTNPTCICCGKPLTKYLKFVGGEGKFCSPHCSRSRTNKLKFENHPELKIKMISNRRSHAQRKLVKEKEGK